MSDLEDIFATFRGKLSNYKALTKDQLKIDMDRRYSTGNAYPDNRLWITAHHTELADIISSFLRPVTKGARILEIGCGQGGVAAHNLREAESIVGTDLSDEALKIAKDFFQRFSNISFRQMDAENLDFPEKSFEIVIAKEVLEHLPDPAKCVADVSRVLVDGGFFALSSPNRDSLHLRINRLFGLPDFPCSGDHLNEMTFDEICAILEADNFMVAKAEGAMLLPFHYVKPIFLPEIEKAENTDPEFVEISRVLGRRAGPEFAFGYVILAVKKSKG